MNAYKKSVISKILVFAVCSYGCLMVLFDCPARGAERPSLTINVYSKKTEKPLAGATVTMRDQHYLTGSPGIYRTREQKTGRGGTVEFSSDDFESYTCRCRMGGYQAYREAKPWNWRTADDGHACFEVRIDVQVDGFESASQDIVIGSPGASETFYLDTLRPPKPQRPVQPPIVETIESVIIEESQPLHDNSSKHSLRYFESDSSEYKPPKLSVGDLRLQTVPVDCMIDIAQLGLKDVRKSRTDWYIKNVPAGIYSIGITGLVPIKDPKTQNIKISERSRQFRLPIRTKAETYVLINLMTGEVKDIPAERLLARAREYAKQAEGKPNIETWRNVVRNAEQALAICGVKLNGAEELRDRAKAIVQEMEKRAQSETERIKKLESTAIQIGYEWNVKLNRFEEMDAEFRLTDEKGNDKLPHWLWSRRKFQDVGRWRNGDKLEDEPFRTYKLEPGRYTIEVDMEKSFHKLHFIGRTDKTLTRHKSEHYFTIWEGEIKKLVIKIDDLNDVRVAVSTVR